MADGDGSQTVAKPEGLPDPYWNADSNALNVEALTKDHTELGTLRTFKTEHDTRAASLPKKAEDYKFVLPESVKLPKGVEWKPDAADPLASKFAAIALKHTASQALVSDILGLWAELNLEGMTAEQASTAEAEAAAKTADDTAKKELHTALGDGADGRLTAAATWLGASFKDKDQLDAMTTLLKSKGGVEAVEGLIETLKGIQMRGGPSNGSGKTQPKSTADMLYGGAAN